PTTMRLLGHADLQKVMMRWSTAENENDQNNRDRRIAREMKKTRRQGERDPWMYYNIRMTDGRGAPPFRSSACMSRRRPLTSSSVTGASLFRLNSTTLYQSYLRRLHRLFHRLDQPSVYRWRRHYHSIASRKRSSQATVDRASIQVADNKPDLLCQQ